MIVRARHILPIDAPPIENGAMQIEGSRIVAVAPADELSRGNAIDLGDVVILPGFVNAHTHLELTFLEGAVPPNGDFVDWLQRLVPKLRGHPLDDPIWADSVVEGVKRSLSSGVTAVGDITARPAATRPALATSGIWGVSFGEVIAIGTGRGLLEERLAAAMNEECSGPFMRNGLSPHSPYSLDPKGLKSCADRASELSVPICVHACESVDEIEFTMVRRGRLVEYFKKLTVWDETIPISGTRPIELLDQCGLLGPRTILAHANYVTDQEIERLSSMRCSVAYCPRTHKAFGHLPHRFREMLAAGVNVCIGTDSLASNPSLSVLDEIRLLHREYPTFDPHRLLEMATMRGAKGLGLEAEIGALTLGRSADWIAIPLSRGAKQWHDFLRDDAQPTVVSLRGVLRVGLMDQCGS